MHFLALPPVVKIAFLSLWGALGLVVAIRLLGGLIGSDSSAVKSPPNTSNQKHESIAEIVETIFDADEPIATEMRSRQSGYVVNVPLRAKAEFKKIQVRDIPASALPPSLSDAAPYLILHDYLPPGKTFNLDSISTLDRGAVVMGLVIAGFDSTGGKIIPVLFMDEGGQVSLLARDSELQPLADESVAAVAEYTARSDLVEEEIREFRTNAFRGVPSSCQRELAPLLREAIRLTSYCPTIAEETARDDCFLSRDRINSEIGQCQSQSRLHQEGISRVQQATREFADRKRQQFIQLLINESRTLARTTVLSAQ